MLEPPVQCLTYRGSEGPGGGEHFCIVIPVTADVLSHPHRHHAHQSNKNGKSLFTHANKNITDTTGTFIPLANKQLDFLTSRYFN